jgi:hypothetical protein
LGDGELRRIARLFQQKLVRPGETISVQGGAGDEAFIVLRGHVEIMFNDPPRPLAVISPVKFSVSKRSSTVPPAPRRR